jgi:DNA-binding GntR family transcriptional regulator
MPIREALQKLEGEGLIAITPHHGAQVRGVTKEFIENIYDLRYAIENLLIHKALERMDDHILDQLARAQDKYAQIARSKNRNIAMMLEANRAFHEIHNKAAGNDEALAVLNRFWMILVNLRINLGFGAKRLKEIIEEHRAMVEAFRKKDLEALMAAHARHCENATKDLLKLFHEKQL